MNGAAEALLQDLLAQATTQTQLLQRLARAFSAPVSGGGGGGGSTAAAAGAGLTSLVSSINPAALAFKAVSSVFGILGSIVGTTIKAFVGLIQGIEQFALKAVGSGARFSDFFGIFENLPLVGPIFGFVKGLQAAVEAIMDSWKAVSQVGAGFNGSFSQFRASAVSAGLSLDEYKNVITKNAESLALFGGTTEKGAVALGRMNRQFMMGAEGTGRSILSLGVGFDEGAGYLASYMGQMSKLGLSQTMSQGDMIKSAQKYVFELDAMAKILGITREEADKRAKEIADDASLQAFLSGLPEGQREMYDEFLKTMNQLEPKSRAQMQNLIMGLSGPVGDFGDIIALSGESQLLSADYLKDLITSVGSGQEAALQVAQKLGTGFGKVSKDMGPLAVQFPALNNQLTSLALRAQRDGKSLSEALQDITENQLKASREGEAAQKREIAMRDMSNKFLDIFLRIMRVLEPPLVSLGNKLIEWVTALAPKIEEKINQFIKWFDETLKVFKNQGWAEGLKKIIKDAFTGISTLWNDIKGPIIEAFMKVVEFLKPYLQNLMDSILGAVGDWIYEKTGFGTGPEERKLLDERRAILRQAEAAANREGADRVKIKAETDSKLREIEAKILAMRLKGFSPVRTEGGRAIYDENVVALKTRDLQDEARFAGTLYPQRHSGTIGMTGNWWEKESGLKNIQQGESVLTQNQLAQIVNTAGQSGLASQVERLNSLTAEMLHYLKETAENTARTHRAAANLNGNLLVG